MVKYQSDNSGNSQQCPQQDQIDIINPYQKTECQTSKLSQNNENIKVINKSQLPIQSEKEQQNLYSEKLSKKIQSKYEKKKQISLKNAPLQTNNIKDQLQPIQLSQSDVFLTLLQTQPKVNDNNCIFCKQQIPSDILDTHYKQIHKIDYENFYEIDSYITGLQSIENPTFTKINLSKIPIFKFNPGGSQDNSSKKKKTKKNQSENSKNKTKESKQSSSIQKSSTITSSLDSDSEKNSQKQKFYKNNDTDQKIFQNINYIRLKMMFELYVVKQKIMSKSCNIMKQSKLFEWVDIDSYKDFFYYEKFIGFLKRIKSKKNYDEIGFKIVWDIKNLKNILRKFEEQYKKIGKEEISQISKDFADYYGEQVGYNPELQKTQKTNPFITFYKSLQDIINNGKKQEQKLANSEQGKFAKSIFQKVYMQQLSSLLQDIHKYIEYSDEEFQIKSDQLYNKFKEIKEDVSMQAWIQICGYHPLQIQNLNLNALEKKLSEEFMKKKEVYKDLVYEVNKFTEQNFSSKNIYHDKIEFLYKNELQQLNKSNSNDKDKKSEGKTEKDRTKSSSSKKSNFYGNINLQMFQLVAQLEFEGQEFSILVDIKDSNEEQESICFSPLSLCSEDILENIIKSKNKGDFQKDLESCLVEEKQILTQQQVEDLSDFLGEAMQNFNKLKQEWEGEKNLFKNFKHSDKTLNTNNILHTEWAFFQFLILNLEIICNNFWGKIDNFLEKKKELEGKKLKILDFTVETISLKESCTFCVFFQLSNSILMKKILKKKLENTLTNKNVEISQEMSKFLKIRFNYLKKLEKGRPRLNYNRFYILQNDFISSKVEANQYKQQSQQQQSSQSYQQQQSQQQQIQKTQNFPYNLEEKKSKSGDQQVLQSSEISKLSFKKTSQVMKEIEEEKQDKESDKEIEILKQISQQKAEEDFEQRRNKEKQNVKNALINQIFIMKDKATNVSVSKIIKKMLEQENQGEVLNLEENPLVFISGYLSDSFQYKYEKLRHLKKDMLGIQEEAFDKYYMYPNYNFDHVPDNDK